MSTPPVPVLVFGATGPSGLCIVRESLHRGHHTIAYVRNPAKFPEDLAANPELEIIQGEMSDAAGVNAAVARIGASGVVISILGPSAPTAEVRKQPAGLYESFYADQILPAMKQHGVRRVLAMSTTSYIDTQGGDADSALRWVLRTGVWLTFGAAYRTMLGIAGVFRDEGEREGSEIEWTVYRVPVLLGGDASWAVDREQGDVHAGPTGSEWMYSIRRGQLARWLLDQAEDTAGRFVRAFPAVSTARVK
ncbi:hypothetical protein B0T24DRAFT_701742 [Lasiosphaeria ovina]|uniref:NAD(P)-binding domain-containing protein n=1 Tax=Lasiosphaeria ovina TaxID=92902 RepID=A0AAE0NC87_9PEZI|nr:hypothetical protein B0T24DRAFT_701742 [Lasiosphaeria ovina]